MRCGRYFLYLLMLTMITSVADAKNKRLENKVVETATLLAKDREAFFSHSEAMPVVDFMVQWVALVADLDKNYQGHTFELKRFGKDVAIRKGFSHLIYMALRIQQKFDLEPLVQDVISRHPFLQELTVEGTCYTGGDAFPKKMKDLLKAYPEMQGVIRAKLDDWDKGNRENFEKEFGNAG